MKSQPITQPGIFQLQRNGSDRTVLLAFNTDSAESNLKALPRRESEKSPTATRRPSPTLSPPTNHSTAPAATAVNSGSRSSSPSSALLFFEEVLLQQRIARG
ncbi:MAG: hypothetical protein R3F13_00105 [Prosthecobacter sp.]